MLHGLGLLLASADSADVALLMASIQMVDGLLLLVD